MHLLHNFDEFANLQELKKLNLTGNNFQEFPKAILKLKNLKEIDLQHCELKSLPDEFANLQSLEKLNLNENYFKEFPKAICELKNLKELNFIGHIKYIKSDYRLKSLPDEFAKLQSLEKLDLRHNNFQEFPKAICDIKNLKELHFSHCDLEILPNEIVNLQRLEKLDLDHNKFQEFLKILLKLKMFKECKELYLWGWGLKSLPDGFANLQSLERLDLYSNNFQEFPKIIYKLKNLKKYEIYIKKTDYIHKIDVDNFDAGYRITFYHW